MQLDLQSAQPHLSWPSSAHPGPSSAGKEPHPLSHCSLPWERGAGLALEAAGAAAKQLELCSTPSHCHLCLSCLRLFSPSKGQVATSCGGFVLVQTKISAHTAAQRMRASQDPRSTFAPPAFSFLDKEVPWSISSFCTSGFNAFFQFREKTDLLTLFHSREACRMFITGHRTVRGLRLSSTRSDEPLPWAEPGWVLQTSTALCVSIFTSNVWQTTLPGVESYCSALSVPRDRH